MRRLQLALSSSRSDTASAGAGAATVARVLLLQARLSDGTGGSGIYARPAGVAWDAARVAFYFGLLVFLALWSTCLSCALRRCLREHHQWHAAASHHSSGPPGSVDHAAPDLPILVCEPAGELALAVKIAAPPESPSEPGTPVPGGPGLHRFQAYALDTDEEAGEGTASPSGGSPVSIDIGAAAAGAWGCRPASCS